MSTTSIRPVVNTLKSINNPTSLPSQMQLSLHLRRLFNALKLFSEAPLLCPFFSLKKLVCFDSDPVLLRSVSSFIVLLFSLAKPFSGKPSIYLFILRIFRHPTQKEKASGYQKPESQKPLTANKSNIVSLMC